MDRMDAFHHMVLSIAEGLCADLRRGADFPSDILETALAVSLPRLDAGIAENDGELASTAVEFVRWQLELDPAPDWVKGLYREMGLDFEE